MDISKINNFSSLKDAFIKIDKSGDGLVSKEEAPEDVAKYDSNQNKSVELWEYMEAVNRETKQKIFKNHELAAASKLSPESLTQLYSTLTYYNFPKNLAIDTMLFIAKINRIQELIKDCSFFEVTSTIMGPSQIFSFIQEFAPYFNFNYESTSLLAELLKSRWDTKEIVVFFKFISNAIKDFPFIPVFTNKLIAHFNQRLKSTLDLEHPQNLTELLSSEIPHIKENFPPILFERYLSNLFILAIKKNDINTIKLVVENISNLSTINSRKLALLKYLSDTRELNASKISHKSFPGIYKIDGLTIILPKKEEFEFIVLPGSAKFENNRTTIDYYNRKNFGAVFGNPIENVSYADELTHISEILPQDFFTSFDRINRLQVVFHNDKEMDCPGYYSDIVVVNTQYEVDRSTIVHELAHHWDLSLTVGFSGKQGSAGDLSMLYYQISWNGDKIKNELVSSGKKDFAREYGMTNKVEDLATMMESYVCHAESLRKTIREQIENGKFELAAKYLFVKYLSPFRGREYDTSKSDAGISFEEVEKAIKEIAFLSTSAPKTIEIIAEIKRIYSAK